jgi:hypothetical protein
VTFSKTPEKVAPLTLTPWFAHQQIGMNLFAVAQPKVPKAVQLLPLTFRERQISNVNAACNIKSNKSIFGLSENLSLVDMI